MIFTKLLSGIILMKKLCDNDRQKWFTITPPSARMIGKNSLRIDVPRNSKDYPNKEFEKTGKWAERHTRWLNMRVKPDGEFKNEAFKIIADTITQGSFEYVGTDDMLTKALGNAEHSGRIRGQSKFVKQSQYFNLVQSSRENAEVSDMKRQLAALERIVQELCAKHSINRETSCTVNEKQAGPSDPQPMPNASKECQLFLTNLVNEGDVLVAIGRAYMDCVPTDTVHGIPLGEECNDLPNVVMEWLGRQVQSNSNHGPNPT
ncbi:hypothetical protein TIFTF001_016574 [Ficus carica]|uniref:Uncharacterized protein n=1 Tax=Ficus carica TaxID=3494 RepID=A0AA88A3D0_FICCA|nr:hypothetical protein TIFTF001_016574 [Ficus carica]